MIFKDFFQDKEQIRSLKEQQFTYDPIIKKELMDKISLLTQPTHIHQQQQKINKTN